MTMRIVLLSEVNSKFGGPFLNDLLLHPDVTLAGLVTSPSGQVCDYYVGEPDPVDLAEDARRAGVPVLRAPKVNDPAVVDQIAGLEADYLLIANYQQILRDTLLGVPKRGVVNFHPSPLPRYAGLAPFFWMAYQGERVSGVSAVVTTAGIDDGPVLGSRQVLLSGEETAGEIRDMLFAESRRLLHQMVPRLAQGNLTGVPQDLARRSYFSRPGPEHVTVDWSWPAERVLRVVRACSPQPGALVPTDGGGIRIHAAGLAPDGALATAPPGEVVCDAALGLAIRCADRWIQICSLSWVPAEVQHQVRHQAHQVPRHSGHHDAGHGVDAGHHDVGHRPLAAADPITKALISP